MISGKLVECTSIHISRVIFSYILTFGFTYPTPAVAIKKQENKKELWFVIKNEDQTRFVLLVLLLLLIYPGNV